MNINPTINTKLTTTFVIWLVAGVCAILGLLPPVHVLCAALLIGLLFMYDTAQATYLKAPAWIGVFVAGIFMALYRPEGFSYWNSISVEQLHDNGKPYQQFVNLGKFFGALIIFCWVMIGSIKSDVRRAMFRRNLGIIFAFALSVLLLATLILDLNLTPKISDLMLLFLLINLVVTCFSEEAFYRLVVQKPSERAFSTVWISRLFGVAVVSTFFALTHFSGDPYILAVMIIAGVFYAVVYALTRSVSAAILTHFLVNALHFIFLPYPL